MLAGELDGEPQRGGGRHRHLRQQQPFERPGGARPLLLVHQRLVHAGKLRGIEARQRHQHLGDHRVAACAAWPTSRRRRRARSRLPSSAISAMSWPNLPRLPVTSDSQPAKSARLSRWLCHCGASPRPRRAASRAAHAPAPCRQAFPACPPRRRTARPAAAATAPPAVRDAVRAAAAMQRCGRDTVDRDRRAACASCRSAPLASEAGVHARRGARSARRAGGRSARRPASAEAPARYR